MLKYLLSIFVLCLACGSVDGVDDPVGTDEQPLFGATRPGGVNYGITSVPGHFRCVTSGSLSQDCYIPVFQSRNPRVCLAATGLQSLYISAANTALGAIAAQNTNWTITYSQNSLTTCENNLTNGLTDIVVQAVTNFCGSSCTKTGTIDNCVCDSPFVGALLSESLDGVYHQMFGGHIYIDTGHLSAMMGVTSTDLSNIVAHGVAHDLVALMGIGAVNHAAGNSANASDVQALDTGAATTLTAGELCQLQDYHGTFPTLYENHYACSM